jgi:hypothetical protein
MLATELKDGLANFDPFAPSFSPDSLFILSPVLQRTLPFVKELDTDDMKTILAKLQDVLIQAQDRALPYTMELADEYNEGYFHSDATCLYITRHQFELGKIHSSPLEKEHPERTWATIFGVIAAGYIGLYKQMLERPDPTIEEIIETKLFESDLDKSIKRNIAANILLDYQQMKKHGVYFAMEAVLFAVQTELVGQNSTSSKERAKAGGAARRDRFAPLKEHVCLEFLELQKQYKENDREISNRQAAKFIVDHTPDDLLRLLTTDDSYHRVEVWISEYKKGKLNGKGSAPEYPS